MKKKSNTTINNLFQIIQKVTGVTRKQIISKRKHGVKRRNAMQFESARARAIFCKILLWHFDYGTCEIAKKLNRHHSSIPNLINSPKSRYDEEDINNIVKIMAKNKC